MWIILCMTETFMLSSDNDNLMIISRIIRSTNMKSSSLIVFHKSIIDKVSSSFSSGGRNQKFAIFAFDCGNEKFPDWKQTWNLVSIAFMTMLWWQKVTWATNEKLFLIWNTLADYPDTIKYLDICWIYVGYMDICNFWFYPDSWTFQGYS